MALEFQLKFANLTVVFCLTSFIFLCLAPETSLAIEYECDPKKDCDATGIKVGDKVPDPRNCSNFYLCIEIHGQPTIIPSDSAIPCPPGKYFDHLKGNCIPENGEPCVDNCLHLCPTTCEKENQLIAYPGDCTKYIACVAGLNPVEIQCPDGMYFNGDTCSDDETLCCDTCKAFCDAPYIETEDPFDCEAFYICSGRGVPKDVERYFCEKGKYFVESEGRCIGYEDEEEACQPLCKQKAENSSLSNY